MSSKRKRVVYLGPAGSFSHEAAMARLARYEMIEKDTLEDVFDSVFVGEADYGVLPVENSTEGIIALTYHKLVEQGLNPAVKIQGEIYHPVSHNLGAVASVTLESIEYVHTKQEAWDQCRVWVSRNLQRGVKFVAESSTSRAAQIVAEKNEHNRAAIASSLAMQLSGLQIIAKAIQYPPANSTRFFIIGRRPLRKPRKKIHYKATMGIVLLDRIGAIADSFKVFAENRVDVRSVKVSPVRAPEILNWKDWFFVDVLAPDGNFANVSQAAEQLRTQEALVLTIRELGRYPSSHPEEVSTAETRLPALPRDFGTPAGLSLEDIIAAGEGTNTEFKSTLRWNQKDAKVDKEIEFAILKTIAGFMNSKGGLVLIGVEDDGSIYGLDDDYKTLHKHSRDGFELHLRNLVQQTVSGALANLLDVRFVLKEEKDVCIVTTQPSPSPIWIRREGKNEFYVRSGNLTKALDSRETAEYVKLRWG